MRRKPDYALLDIPAVLQFVFYPRPDYSATPVGAEDHQIAVEPDVSLYCRFYSVSGEAPTILYFHGNGEVVFDHDWIAPLYHRIGANLFVADYRGYGRSSGSPTFESLAADAHRILDYFSTYRKSNGYTGPVFVMGRSLGSISAIELAANHPQEFGGLILESGFFCITRLLRYLHLPFDIPDVGDFENDSLQMIRRISMPSLVMHGLQDALIPHDEAIFTYENLGSVQKRLLSIPAAGHNDILIIGMDEYFAAVKDLIGNTDAEINGG